MGGEKKDGGKQKKWQSLREADPGEEFPWHRSQAEFGLDPNGLAHTRFIRLAPDELDAPTPNLTKTESINESGGPGYFFCQSPVLTLIGPSSLLI